MIEANQSLMFDNFFTNTVTKYFKDDKPQHKKENTSISDIFSDLTFLPDEFSLLPKKDYGCQTLK